MFNHVKYMNKIKGCIANAPLVGTSVISPPPPLIILKVMDFKLWIIDLSLTQSLKGAGVDQSLRL